MFYYMYNLLRFYLFVNCYFCYYYYYYHVIMLLCKGEQQASITDLITDHYLRV